MLLSLFSGSFSGTALAIMAITLILRVPAVLLSLSLHEASHGFVADKLGDPTARNLGRITINPLKHIDPFGALSMLIFGVGWAKPVPVNSRYFKKPKRDMALTAAAGPLSNILQGLIAIILLFLFTKIFLLDNEISLFVSLYNIDCGSYGGLYTLLISVIVQSAFPFGLRAAALLLYLLFVYAALNFALALFNLIPIPPFDGSRIAFVFLPDKYYFAIMKYERIIMIAFLVLFLVGGRLGWFDGIFSGFTNLFFRAFSWIL